MNATEIKPNVTAAFRAQQRAEILQKLREYKPGTVWELSEIYIALDELASEVMSQTVPEPREIAPEYPRKKTNFAKRLFG